MELPEKIKHLIDTEQYEKDTIGMSSASILLFEDKVLKITEADGEAENEVGVMQWLSGKLPVPKVFCHEIYKDRSYLLMSKLPGVMACDPSLLSNPPRLTAILAEGLKQLWQVEISACPFDNGLAKKLEMAKYNVEHDLVDVNNVEPETFGKDGFRNPAHLLDWLIENQPEEELVFSHGDFCLPNLFVKDGKVSGFLDLGKCGRADRYQDIALCYRSLQHNFNGKYGSHEGLDPDLLFELLGIEPDYNKIKYYKLLDELF